MRILKKLMLLALLLSINLWATVHENAESGTIKNWIMPFTLHKGNSNADKYYNDKVKRHIDTPVKGTVKNIYDRALKSRVIQLRGEGYKTVYVIGMDITRYYRSRTYAMGSGWGTSNKSLSFKVKSTDGFLMDVWVRTTKGRMLIRYSDTEVDQGLEDADAEENFKFHSTKNRIVNIALGYEAADGNWHTYKRDLLKDIRKFIPKIDIYSVEGLEIRGNCSFDDIKTEKSTTPGIGKISGKVWNDNNRDWEINNGEKGFAGVTVNLFYRYNKPNKIIAKTKTDKNGNYSFKHLNAASYNLSIDVPNNAENVTPDRIDEYIELGKVFEHKNADFGIIKKEANKFTISGIVWQDKNEDWEYGTDEHRFYGPSAKVVLYDGAGNELDDVKGRGKYKFINLPIGEYKVEVFDSDGVITEKVIELWLEEDVDNINFGVKY